jgi:transcriptional regulator with XRE-family HTH domain
MFDLGKILTEKFKELEAKGETQSSLAASMGIHRTNLSAWKHGLGWPGADRLRQLEEMLEMPQGALDIHRALNQLEDRDLNLALLANPEIMAMHDVIIAPPAANALTPDQAKAAGMIAAGDWAGLARWAMDKATASAPSAALMEALAKANTPAEITAIRKRFGVGAPRVTGGGGAARISFNDPPEGEVEPAAKKPPAKKK